MRWSEADLAHLQATPAPPAPAPRLKYGNQPTVVDGVRFDSKAEANRWGNLQLMQAAGEISNLKRQVRFEIHVGGYHICDYIADATYVRDGQYVVEDTKSKATRTPVYRLKRKLMRAVYQIEVLET